MCHLEIVIDVSSKRLNTCPAILSLPSQFCPVVYKLLLLYLYPRFVFYTVRVFCLYARLISFLAASVSGCQGPGCYSICQRWYKLRCIDDILASLSLSTPLVACCVLNLISLYNLLSSGIVLPRFQEFYTTSKDSFLIFVSLLFVLFPLISTAGMLSQ